MRFENLALRPPIEPMETRQLQNIPEGEEWSYEPKWDGFRCIAFREDGEIELQSKSGESLTRYFPEIVATLAESQTRQFVIDGELLIAGETASDFDALLQRIHPAASRVQKLAKETPATYVLFDVLVDGKSALYEKPLRARRERLETLRRAKNFGTSRTIRLRRTTRRCRGRKAMARR